jgi:hypothetical protein
VRIYTRADWGARFGSGVVRTAMARGVVVHHSFLPDIPAGRTPADVAAAVRSIEHYHTQVNGWGRIGYNWMIDQDGRVWEGLGWGRIGAHAAGANATHEGLCFLINGTSKLPSPLAWGAAAELVRVGLGAGRLVPEYTVTGHRDWMKGRDCPGAALYAALDRLRGLGAGEPPPEPGERRWSPALREWVVLTRWVSDAEWYFVPSKRLTDLPSIRAGARWSQMPESP